MTKISANRAPEGAENKETGSKDMKQEEEIDSQDMDYAQLYDALEEISNYLDDLETRNEVLHRELSSLLESNRQIRKELQNAAQ